MDDGYPRSRCRTHRCRPGKQEAVKQWHKRFDLLYNWVDARNKVHVKWLRWLGFIFINKHHNDQGIPFYEFVKVKTDV